MLIELGHPPALPTEGILLGDVYDLKPDGATFDPPLPISLPYDPSSLPAGIDERELRIAEFDPSTGDWTTLPSEANLDNRTVIAEVSYLSKFSVIAPGVAGNTPLNASGFSFSSLIVDPSRPYAGQAVTISVVATYGGSNANVRSQVYMTVNDQTEGEQEISLSPGDRLVLTFDYEPPEEGTYEVEVHGLSAVFTSTGHPSTLEPSQTIGLSEHDVFQPMTLDSPSLLSRWRWVAYPTGAMLLLLLVGPLISALQRRILRLRYDL